MDRLLITICFLALFGYGLAQAPATKQVKYVATQDLIKRSTLNGKTIEEVLPSPKTVLSGDILREQVVLTNISGKNLGRMLVSLPMPGGTEFLGNVTPALSQVQVQYSADGGKTYAAFPQRRVKVAENGQAITKQVAAASNTYTHVRWVIAGLKSDESLKLSFRVKVK